MDRLVYAVDVRRSMIETLKGLEEVIAEAADELTETERRDVARVLGVPAAVVLRMVRDGSMPDVGLLLNAARAANRRAGIDLDVIVDLGDILNVTGASDLEIQRMARLLCRVADQIPLEGAVWAAAPGAEREQFAAGVAYARSLVEASAP